MNTKNSILIFHRSKKLCEEDLVNQQAFLDLHKSDLGSTEIINYQTGENATVLKILESTIEKTIEGQAKLIVVLNSHLTQKEQDLQYDLYSFFSGMEGLNFASIYLMDSWGKLYKRTKTIE